jgi:hypothetical protein
VMRLLFLIIVAWMITSCDAEAHDWYMGKKTNKSHPTHPEWSCCTGDPDKGDCHPVQAWQNADGRWVFRYVDGVEWEVPDYALKSDAENEEPFQASACVYKGVLMCFWRKGAGG